MPNNNSTQILSELPKSVTLLAASKKQSRTKIRQAVKEGIMVFGENYVQQATKFDIVKKESPQVKLHLIGPLQSNKTKRAVEKFDCIQTVATKKTIELIEKHASAQNKVMDVFIQVNIGNEPQKGGCKVGEIGSLIQKIKTLHHIHLRGFMAIPPQENTQKYFKKMRELKEKFNLPELSMGMSSDYKIAIGEGTTMIRLGTALFGERKNKKKKKVKKKSVKKKKQQITKKKK